MQSGNQTHYFIANSKSGSLTILMHVYAREYLCRLNNAVMSRGSVAHH